MKVDKATETLIILVVIIVVMAIFLFLTIFVLAFRWKRYKAKNRMLTYSYSFARKRPSLPPPRLARHQRDSSMYATPFFFSDANFLVGESSDEHVSPRTDEDIPLYASPRISAISGTSVDIGNLRDVSGFVRDPRIGQFRQPKIETDLERAKVDSMRSSMGVDLGGSYNKAWSTYRTGQRFDL